MLMSFVSVYDVYKYVSVVVYLATGPWDVSESWGGDVPASDSDPFAPRLHRYLLRKPTTLLKPLHSSLPSPCVISGDLPTLAPVHSTI